MGTFHYFPVANGNRCLCGQAPQGLEQQVTGRVRGLAQGQRGFLPTAPGQQHQRPGPGPVGSPVDAASGQCRLDGHGNRLRMPVTVLQQDWGEALGFDAAARWDAWAPNLRHSTVSYGHFMAEEAPADWPRRCGTCCAGWLTASVKPSCEIQR
jgi:hypothetical protein